MTKEDFLAQIKKLEINFDKRLKLERLEQLYLCFSNITSRKFGRMTAHIITNKEMFRFTVAEFRSAKNEIHEEKISEKYQCVKCLDRGKIFRGDRYMGRCDCTVKSEDIRALLVLMNHSELLDPI